MTGPTAFAFAVAKIAFAMSKVSMRMLMAGTVKPRTSPRLRAAYRSWMLADGAPSSWLASQISQRAASTVAGSCENVCVQARSSMVRARNVASSVTSSRPPSTRAGPSRSPMSCGMLSATVAMSLPPAWRGGVRGRRDGWTDDRVGPDEPAASWYAARPGPLPGRPDHVPGPKVVRGTQAPRAPRLPDACLGGKGGHDPVQLGGHTVRECRHLVRCQHGSDPLPGAGTRLGPAGRLPVLPRPAVEQARPPELPHVCLLYTSDAADDLLCVDLGGRRIIKK